MTQVAVLCTGTWAGSNRRKANENCKVYTKQQFSKLIECVDRMAEDSLVL